MPIRSDKNDFFPSGLWFTSAHIAVASYLKKLGTTLSSCRTASDVNYWANMIIKEAKAIKRKAARMDWNK
jgi:hypothetical protein